MKNSKDSKPKSGTLCYITLKNGSKCFAKWILRINKYIYCYRWQKPDKNLSKKEKWIDDDQVVDWEIANM